MTDEEIINICAEATGVKRDDWCWYDVDKKFHPGKYNPVEKGAHAFYLLQKYQLNAAWEDNLTIHVQFSKNEYPEEIFTVSDHCGNMSRAIALCVANMYKNREKISVLDPSETR